MYGYTFIYTCTMYRLSLGVGLETSDDGYKTVFRTICMSMYFCMNVLYMRICMSILHVSVCLYMWVHKLSLSWSLYVGLVGTTPDDFVNASHYLLPVMYQGV